MGRKRTKRRAIRYENYGKKTAQNIRQCGRLFQDAVFQGFCHSDADSWTWTAFSSDNEADHGVHELQC